MCIHTSVFLFGRFPLVFFNLRSLKMFMMSDQHLMLMLNGSSRVGSGGVRNITSRLGPPWPSPTLERRPRPVKSPDENNGMFMSFVYMAKATVGGVTFGNFFCSASGSFRANDPPPVCLQALSFRVVLILLYGSATNGMVSYAAPKTSPEIFCQ